MFERLLQGDEPSSADGAPLTGAWARLAASNVRPNSDPKPDIVFTANGSATRRQRGAPLAANRRAVGRKTAEPRSVELRSGSAAVAAPYLSPERTEQAAACSALSERRLAPRLLEWRVEQDGPPRQERHFPQPDLRNFSEGWKTGLRTSLGRSHRARNGALSPGFIPQVADLADRSWRNPHRRRAAGKHGPWRWRS